MPQQQQQETPEQQQTRLARERADALERELAASRAMETERRQSIAPITEALPRVQLERMGGAEEQAQRSQLARELMAQQQAGQRQLLSQQAKQGVRGGAASAQQSRLAQQIAANQASQEEQRFLAQRQFNMQQAQREQFANTASELARRQLMAALRGQDVSAEAARQFGAQQLATAQQGGKVICSELYRQGYMDETTFEADQRFGAHLRKFSPETLLGYWTWAFPVVHLMQRFSFVTRLVAVIAKPWAEEMAFRVGAKEKGNKIGSVIMAIGLPICRLIGRARYRYAAN